jgi:hypothetical protein
MKPIRRASWLLMLGVSTVLTTSAFLTRAEVALSGTPVPADAKLGPRAELKPVHPDLDLRVQCWQAGVKIIDRDGLRGLSINSVTRSDSVGFKQPDDTQPSTFLVPFEEGLCLIQPDE